MKRFFNKITNFIKRNKKKSIAILIILILLMGFIFIRKKNASQGQSIPSTEVTELEKKDLINSVTESGVIVTENSAYVYAEKPSPVKEIYKKVGDHVKEGDIIAKLDDSQVRQQIAQKKAAISASNSAAGAQIKSAKDRLNEAIKNKNNGTNSALQSANSAVTSAYDAWQSAEKTYNDYKNSIEQGYNDQIVSANAQSESLQANLKTARLNKEQAEDKKSETLRKISDYKDNLNSAQRRSDNAKSEIIKLQDKIDSAQEIIDKAKMSASSADDATENNANNKANKANNANKKNKPAAPQGPSPSEVLESQKNITKYTREINSSQKDLQEAEADIAKYQGLIDSASDSIDGINKEIDQNSLALNNAQDAVDTNSMQNSASAKTRQDMLKTYRQAADTAHNAYLSALGAKKTTEVSVDDEIKSLENALKTASTSGDNSVNNVDLKLLKDDLAKTYVKAPTSGTITELNAQVGLTPTDSVAKIETLNEIQVESHVKEFDANSIKVGMKVEITSDALSKKDKFEGKVISIDPTPEKKAQNSNSNEVYYKTKIEITSADKEKLLPGMNVRVKYIIDEHKDVLTVPSTAIFDKGNKQFVLAVKKSASGISTIEEIPVLTGASNDISTAISGKDVHKNLIVINSPENYSSGMEIKIVNSDDTK